MSSLPQPLPELLPLVRDNCMRADAAVAGLFGLCGLLMRLRNLYKWEQGLMPWQEGEPADVLEWVSQREEQWDELGDLTPLPYSLGGESIDPFDTQRVNRLIEPLGYHYSAGWAASGIPLFFLGRLGQRRRHHGLAVTVLDMELTRDIFFLPGLRQGGNLYLRPEPMAFLVWDKIADPRKSAARFVAFGLHGYGLDRNKVLANPGRQSLDAVMAGELEAVLWHEAGEAAAGPRASELLQTALSQHPASELEHFTRGVKDLLADTTEGGRLAGIIENMSTGALGFYPVWLAGFPRMLFPEIDAAVMEFMAHGHWQTIEKARRLGHDRALEAMARLEPILAKGPGEDTLQTARQQVIAPMTGGRQLPKE